VPQRQAIYFRSNRGGRWQFWKIAATGGTAQPITSLDGIVPQESPDGKYLYYTRGDEAGLCRISTAGGPETQVLQQPSSNYWGYWQITPQGIYYLDRTQPSTRILLFNPDTKQTSTFTTLQHTPPCRVCRDRHPAGNPCTSSIDPVAHEWFIRRNSILDTFMQTPTEQFRKSAQMSDLLSDF
jgi:hypothetical protein